MESAEPMMLQERQEMVKPTGTASNERSFNVLKRTKNFFRNTTDQECLSPSILIATEKELSKTLCLDCVIDRFA